MMVMVIGEFYDDDGSDLYEAGADMRVTKRNCGSYPHPQPIYTYSSSFVITLINLLFIMSVEFCCCVECRVQG